jgi:hypothetical protein
MNLPEPDTPSELMRRVDEILGKAAASGTKDWELANAGKELEELFQLLRGRTP